jgi:WD repeat-containing protein 48
LLLVNVGKWILRYLFAKLIDEEIKRDEAFRQKLNERVVRRLASTRANAPTSISIPPQASGWQPLESTTTTPRANGTHYPPVTPGMGIALATPGLADAATPLTPLDKRSSQVSRPSVEKDDYFSNAIHSADNNQAAKPAQTPAIEGPPEAAKTPATENGKDKDKDKDKEAKETKASGTQFGKKFRMGMSFGTKKLGRSASTTATEKPAVVDEKAEESESSSNHEKEVDDSFLGVIQRIRNEYEKQLSDNPDRHVETKITPSLPSDTPVLKLPSGTKVIIQEETSGGSAELYRGTVETVGADADIIEQRAPMWLGDVLLTNTIPPKDPVKVSFVLHPYADSLPSIATVDGNNRLNANRMLRVKKILSYVAERIDPPADPEHPDPDALKPEEYLELYCNEQVSCPTSQVMNTEQYMLTRSQLLPITMSLATLRAHVWKGGNDIVLYYKANGRKYIPNPPPPPPPEPQAPPEPVSIINATTAAYAAHA